MRVGALQGPGHPALRDPLDRGLGATLDLYLTSVSHPSHRPLREQRVRQ